jgi:uncharacterized protein YoxC
MGNLTSTPTTTGFTQAQADGLYQAKGNYALSTQHTALDQTVGTLRNTITGVDNRVTGINTTVGNLANSFNTFVPTINTSIGNLFNSVNGITTNVNNLATSFSTFSPATATSIGNLSTTIGNLETRVQTNTLWCATGDFCQLPATKRGLQIGEYEIAVNSNNLCIRKYAGANTGGSFCFTGTMLTTGSLLTSAPSFPSLFTSTNPLFIPK